MTSQNSKSSNHLKNPLGYLYLQASKWAEKKINDTYKKLDNYHIKDILNTIKKYVKPMTHITVTHETNKIISNNNSYSFIISSIITTNIKELHQKYIIYVGKPDKNPIEIIKVECFKEKYNGLCYHRDSLGKKIYYFYGNGILIGYFETFKEYKIFKKIYNKAIKYRTPQNHIILQPLYFPLKYTIRKKLMETKRLFDNLMLLRNIVSLEKGCAIESYIVPYEPSDGFCVGGSPIDCLYMNSWSSFIPNNKGHVVFLETNFKIEDKFALTSILSQFLNSPGVLFVLKSTPSEIKIEMSNILLLFFSKSIIKLLSNLFP